MNVNKIPVSDGFLTKVYLESSVALEAARAEIEANIKSKEVLNVDETSHKCAGQTLYNWVFVAAGFAVLYNIGNRTGAILREVLGDTWTGVIGCDFYSVYLSYARDNPGVTLQHCLAHLKRDLVYCSEYLDPDIEQYGIKMLALYENLFDTWHAYKADRTLENFMNVQQAGAIFCREAKNCPDKGKPKAIAKRFEQYPGSYIRFITHDGVEPTNNAAEQAVRRIIVQRYVTQGTRGEAGIIASERYWSVAGTCAMQGKSFFDFFRLCLAAKNNNAPYPSIFGKTSRRS